MQPQIIAQPLTAAAFALFGDVLDCAGPPDRIINAGLCGRWHDRARLDMGPDGRAGISLFRSDLRRLPFVCDLMERHPLGAQAFVPISMDAFMVIVAPDDAGRPGAIRAFLTAPGQGINILRNTWHGVLTPLSGPGLFAVIDRIGPGTNLHEHRLATPVTIVGQDVGQSAGQGAGQGAGQSAGQSAGQGLTRP